METLVGESEDDNSKASVFGGVVQRRGQSDSSPAGVQDSMEGGAGARDLCAQGEWWPGFQVSTVLSLL